MSRDRTRGRPPDSEQDPQPNLPSGPPRNVSTQRIWYVYCPYQPNLDSTPLQEGQDLGPGRFLTLDFDGDMSLLHSVNNVMSHQEQARDQDGLSHPPEAFPVQATSQGDSLERQANVRAESNSIDNNSTARPQRTQQGICEPPVMPQIPQRSSNVREVVAVPDQSGMAVNVPPSPEATVVTQGAEGGCSGFQTLQDPSSSTVIKGMIEVVDQLKVMGYDSQKIKAVQARFGPVSMVSAAVFLEYENKFDAESSSEHSSDVAGQIQSERYHTAQSNLPARDQRVLGTKFNNPLQRYGPGIPYNILEADMAEMYQREHSFLEWRHRSANLSPQRLAEAGLYFTGEKDACRCFSCGGILHRWEENDDPWVEHARLHPNCSYVLYVKGGLFIDQVRFKK